MKKVLIIVYSNYKNDNRVRKHKYFFEKAGYQVDVVGFEKKITWKITLKDKIGYLFNLIFNKEKALFNYFSQLKILENKIDEEKKYDIVLSNDWNTLYTGYKIAKKNNSQLIYDSHEFSLEQEPKNNYKWWLFIRPLIKYIEGKYAAKSVLVLVVSSEIAKRLSNIYKLNNIFTVKNVPLAKEFNKNKIDKTKDLKYPIRLFYSGGVSKNRDLELLIDAIKKFPQKFELHMRLIGDVKYYKKKFEGKNIFIYDPIPPDSLVEEASYYDIGVALIKPSTLNYVYSLPNKFFEYIRAGLPVIVYEKNISMRKIIKKLGIGYIVKKCTRKGIEKKLKKISINNIKKNREKLLDKKLFTAKREWDKIFNNIDKGK